MVVGLSLLGYQAWVATRPVPTAQEAMRASIPGEFQLVDQTGKTVTKADYQGKWLLIFFGYTHCPDVCPTTLNTVAEVLEKLGDRAGQVQPLFITVDPERDTPEQLADYVGAFDPRIAGLGGTPAQIKKAAQSFKVYYARVDQEGGDYSMDHTAYLYVMDPEGRLESVYSFQDDVEKLYEGVNALLTK